MDIFRDISGCLSRASAGSESEDVYEVEVGIEGQLVVTLLPPYGCTSVLFEVQEHRICDDFTVDVRSWHV